jgi:cytochrome c
MRAGFLFILLSTLVLFTSAHADGDPIKGQRQFASCTSCHAIAPGDRPKIGPTLYRIFGKRAGTNQPSYSYSESLVKSGVIWDARNLDLWLKEPSKYIPNNKMTFIGIANGETRANIIAYLQSQSKTSE